MALLPSGIGLYLLRGTFIISAHRQKDQITWMEIIMKRWTRTDHKSTLRACDAHSATQSNSRKIWWHRRIESKGKPTNKWAVNCFSAIQICLRFTFILITTMNSGKMMKRREFAHCRAQQLKLLLLFDRRMENDYYHYSLSLLFVEYGQQCN